MTNQTYEESLEELTDVVQEFSRGNLAVSEIVTKMSRAQDLIKHCRDILSGVLSQIAGVDSDDA